MTYVLGCVFFFFTICACLPFFFKDIWNHPLFLFVEMYVSLCVTYLQFFLCQDDNQFCRSLLLSSAVLMNDKSMWASDQPVHNISSKLNLSHPCEKKEMHKILKEYFTEISREHFLRPHERNKYKYLFSPKGQKW